MTFPIWAWQCDKRPPKATFVVMKNTLKYFSMMRWGRSLAQRGPVILSHGALALLTKNFLRQRIHVLPSRIA
jgi:hypothetical protein